MIALGPAEADIGGAFGQAQAAEQLAVRIPYRDAGIAQHRVGAGPDIAGAVGAHAVGMAVNPIHHAVGEVAQVFDLAVHHIADMDAAADDVDAFVIRREADAVGAAQLFARQRHLQLAAGIPAISVGRQLAPDRGTDAGAHVAKFADHKARPDFAVRRRHRDGLR